MNTVKFLKSVWPFFNIMYKRVEYIKITELQLITCQNIPVYGLDTEIYGLQTETGNIREFVILFPHSFSKGERTY